MAYIVMAYIVMAYIVMVYIAELIQQVLIGWAAFIQPVYKISALRRSHRSEITASEQT